jgi:hypothetical protein
LRGPQTTITASTAACSKKHKCLVSVYNLGRNNAARYVASKTAVRANVVIASHALSISAPAAKLKHGDRYLLVIRAATTKKLLTSTISTIG